MHIAKEKKQKTSTKSIKIIELLFVIAWIFIIGILFFHRDEFNVKTILNFTPKNYLLAALTFLLLFILKSLSIVLYGGALYIATGLVFPIPYAILINLIGTFLMYTTPYIIGRYFGSDLVYDLMKRFPKISKINNFSQENEIFFTFITRVNPLIPADILSLFLGSTNLPYVPYIIGSILGILPQMIIFPIFGSNVQDFNAKELMIAIGSYVLLMIVITIIHRKHKSNHND
ncbi:MAG: VTT domain-containing protein [Clostridiaceae bacterium]|nr:VTT domain-containing protein [Clostridiaceae bacterium]